MPIVSTHMRLYRLLLLGLLLWLSSFAAVCVTSGGIAVLRVGDALDTLIGMSSEQVSVEVDPEKLRVADVSEIRGSHAKLTAATGWKPDLPFERVLQDLLDYWRETF